MAEAITSRTRTKIEKVNQLAELEDAIVSGVAIAVAVREHAEKNGLSLKRARTDVAQLMRRWAKAAKADQDRNAGFAVTLKRLERIFRCAIERDELDVALRAEMQRGQLLGLYPPVQRV